MPAETPISRRDFSIAALEIALLTNSLNRGAGMRE
jgi:hypothetical protein